MNTIHIKLKEFRSGQWVSEYITLHRHATEISPLQTLGATSNKLLSGEDVRMHAAQFAGHRPELDARVFLDHSDTFASVSFALQSLGIRVNDFAGKIETPYGLFDML